MFNFASNSDSQRSKFERALMHEGFFSADIKRKGEDSGFPKEYLNEKVELAWKMWNAALGNRI